MIVSEWKHDLLYWWIRTVLTLLFHFLWMGTKLASFRLLGKMPVRKDLLNKILSDGAIWRAVSVSKRAGISKSELCCCQGFSMLSKRFLPIYEGDFAFLSALYCMDSFFPRKFCMHKKYILVTWPATILPTFYDQILFLLLVVSVLNYFLLFLSGVKTFQICLHVFLAYKSI